MRRLMTCFVLLTMFFGAAAAASAQTTQPPVDVTFKVTLGLASPNGYETADCAVTVPRDSDGVRVLDAAVAAGCIDSYRGSQHPQFGFLLECIEDVCEAPVTYWAYYLNDDPADHGLSAYRARAGHSLEVSYQTWLGCLTPLGCFPV